MSKPIEKFLEGLKEAAALTKEAVGKVYDGMEHPVAHGAHELAAALYTGSAFVMYPRAGKENNDQQQGQNIEGPVAPGQTPEQAHERDNDRGR